MSGLGLLGVKLPHKLGRGYHWDPDSFVYLEEQKEKYSQVILMKSKNISLTWVALRLFSVTADELVEWIFESCKLVQRRDR